MQLDQVILGLWAALAFWGLGQIWLIQIVVYPLFAHAGHAEYVQYHQSYSDRIPLVVVVPGFATFLLPIPLALFGPSIPTWMSLANIIAGLCGLAVTVLLEIPRHSRLQRDGRNARTIAELVRYNWPRTASITAQAILAFMMLRFA